MPSGRAGKVKFVRFGDAVADAGKNRFLRTASVTVSGTPLPVGRVLRDEMTPDSRLGRLYLVVARATGRKEKNASLRQLAQTSVFCKHGTRAVRRHDHIPVERARSEPLEARLHPAVFPHNNTGFRFH